MSREKEKTDQESGSPEQVAENHSSGRVRRRSAVRTRGGGPRDPGGPDATHLNATPDRFHALTMEFARCGLGLDEDHCEDLVTNTLKVCAVAAALSEDVSRDYLWCWRVAFALSEVQKKQHSLLGSLDTDALGAILEKVRDEVVGNRAYRAHRKTGREFNLEDSAAPRPVSTVPVNTRGALDAVTGSRNCLMRAARAWGLSETDAEDLVQKVQLVALGHRLESLENPAAWLRVVLWRKRAAHIRLMSREWELTEKHEACAASCSIECDLARAEMLMYLSAVKRRIDRVALWLTKSLDLTQGEVAFITRKHVNSVANGSARALHQIRAEFGVKMSTRGRR